MAVLCLPAKAEEGFGKTIEQAAARGKAIVSITPVFSQLVRFSFQPGFKPAFQNTQGTSYIQEAVPAGETVERWTQMITLTGAQGYAANPNIAPASFAGSIALGFKRACPESFSTKAVGKLKFGEYEGFGALAACGSVRNGGYPHSEAALIISIKGASDYYTIQWAERGPAQGAPAGIDEAKWRERLAKLNPIKICPRLPGEPAPYPSCAGSN
jgi:hypothetical protein